jgi:hypothetical protein
MDDSEAIEGNRRFPDDSRVVGLESSEDINAVNVQVRPNIGHRILQQLKKPSTWWVIGLGAMTLVFLILSILYAVMYLPRQTPCIISNLQQNLTEDVCYYIDYSVSNQYLCSSGNCDQNYPVVPTACTSLIVGIQWYNCEQTNLYFFTDVQDNVNQYSFFTTPDLQCNYLLNSCNSDPLQVIDPSGVIVTLIILIAFALICGFGFLNSLKILLS